MFAIKRGNGRGFSPESLKQPINKNVAGWTVNQEKIHLLSAHINHLKGMVPPLNYTVWLEPVCILLANSLHGVPAICTVGCFVPVMAYQCGIAVAVYPRGESKGCWCSTNGSKLWHECRKSRQWLWRIIRAIIDRSSSQITFALKIPDSRFKCRHFPDLEQKLGIKCLCL